MKKSFMTRVLAAGLSFAMAFSMAAATNVTTASAATKAAMITASGASAKSLSLKVGETVKIYPNSTAKKTYKVSTAKASSTRLKVAVSKTGAFVAIRGQKATITGKPSAVKVSFKVKKTGKTAKFSYSSKVTVIGEQKPAFGITSVTASKVNELKVAFASPVDITKTTLAVTKNAAAVDAKAEFATDGTSATITTTAKMTKGTYTVTATEGDNKAEGTVVIEDQKVDKIVISNKTALTAPKNGTAAALAYIYYDVLDQYGESLKASTSIEWTTSCGTPKTDRTLGRLTVERSDAKAFTFGEKIYVTGVYTKTGVTVSEELTVGAEQALNNVVLEGFIKTGSSEIVHTIPAGFKDGEYQLLYNVTDQNGDQMEATDYLDSNNNTVTFVSNKVLVVKAIESAGKKNVTIAGKEYCVANIVPGINANEGGEVTIDAIATKTGNKTSLTVVIGDGKILKSFELGAPSGVIADGEKIEIPFTATAEDGSEITSFVTLASQTDFSNLTLNASEGELKLSEKDDGTAKLEWIDYKTAWENDSTDGIARPISLTSVVVGGSTSNEMIYVEDKARPDAIATVNMAKAYVERDSKDIYFSDFEFLDQYGRNMTKAKLKGATDNGKNNDGQIYDNGFFTQVPNTVDFTGVDFKGYTFGINAEFKGTMNPTGTTPKYVTLDDFSVADGKLSCFMTYTGTSEVFDMVAKANSVGTNSGDQTITYTIAKQKNGETEGISTSHNASFRVVDLDLVSGFEIDTADKFFVATTNSGNATGDTNVVGDGNINSEAVTSSAIGLTATTSNSYQKDVKVNGTFNGIKVSVPAVYYTVSANKLAATGTGVGTGMIKINAVEAGALKWSDLYDATTARYVRKDADDTIKVTLYTENADGDLDATCAVKDTASKKVKISDAKPYAAEILALDKVTITPWLTGYDLLNGNIDGTVAKTDDGGQTYYYTQLMDKAKLEGKKHVIVNDQYGVEITASAKISVKVSAIKENADRYVLNNAKVISNDTQNAKLTGVELGDTMTVTLYAKDADGNNTVSKEIALTVGADSAAFISGSDNFYKAVLVNGGNYYTGGSQTPIAPSTYLQKQLQEVLSSN